MSHPIATDALIIGAGPVGLFQIFELGLLGIRAHIVDALPKPGGQCTELYPDKPIYDIPALPICGAQELIDRLLEQGKPFDPVFHLGQEVTDVLHHTDGSFYVRTSAGTEFHAKTVIIAGGVGAFQPRALNVSGATEMVDKHLFYKVKDPSRFHGKNLVICGGGDSALDWALDLYNKAESVTLVHRSQEFRAAPASVTKMRQLCDNLEMLFLEGTIAALNHDGETLQSLSVTGKDGVTRRVEADDVLVFWGLLPKLGPIANWNLKLSRNQIEVDTEKFQTNIPGIFAIGDINTYPGKKKLILSGFHEAALAAFGVHKHLYPEEKVHLQYTTTSTALHKRLGVTASA